MSGSGGDTDGKTPVLFSECVDLSIGEWDWGRGGWWGDEGDGGRTGGSDSREAIGHFQAKTDLDDGEGAERQSDDEDRKGKLQALAACLKVKK